MAERWMKDGMGEISHVINGSIDVAERTSWVVRWRNLPLICIVEIYYHFSYRRYKETSICSLSILSFFGGLVVVIQCTGRPFHPRSGSTVVIITHVHLLKHGGYAMERRDGKGKGQDLPVPSPDPTYDAVESSNNNEWQVLYYGGAGSSLQ